MMKVIVRASPGARVIGTASAAFHVRPATLGVVSAPLLNRPLAPNSDQKVSSRSHCVRYVASGDSVASAMLP